MRHLEPVALCALAAALAWSPSASAQDKTAAETADAVSTTDIIVTAERRSVNLQKTALSITAVTGDALLVRGATSVADAVKSAPSVVIQQSTGGYSASTVIGGGGPPNMAIRGLGTDGFNKQPAVRTYQDGVLLVGGGAFFYDLDRVEVLRGPQGTLYGRGAVGGAVNIITRKPVQEDAGFVQMGLANYGQVDAQAMFNTSVTDDLAVRVAGNFVRHDGYFNNGQSAANEVSVRGQALYKNDDISLLVSGTHYRNRSSSPGKVIVTAADPYVHNWNTIEPDGGYTNGKYTEIHAELNWNLGAVTLTYLPSFASFDSYSVQLLQYGRYNGKEIGNQPYHRVHSQEVRLGYDDDKLQVQGGLFYYNEQFEYIYLNLSPNAAAGVGIDAYGYNASSNGTHQVFDLTSAAAFAQATYSLSDAVRLTLGGRYTYDKVDQLFEGYHAAITPGSNPVVAPYTKSWTRFDWKVRAEADLSSVNMLYGSITTGYRPGSSTIGVPYQPETVTTYEVGSKNSFLNGAVVANLSAFYSHYPKYQIVQTYILSNGDLRAYIPQVPVTFYGLEAEFTLRPTSADTLNLSGSWLHARFDDNVSATNPTTQVTTVYQTKGEILPHAPAWHLTAGYQHVFDLASGAQVAFSGDLTYQSKQTTDYDGSNYPRPNPIYLQPATTEYNASLTYTSPSKRYRVSLYGKNLSNVIYKIQANVAPGVHYVNDPRTYGLRVSASF